jgi:hypothetical protein
MARSRLFYVSGVIVHNRFTPSPLTFGDMGDFLSVLGFVAFVVVMLGLVWGLDHV